jgi:antitoxin PrlF
MAESTLTANGRTTVPAEIRLTIGTVSETRLVWCYVAEGRLSARVKNKTTAEVKGIVKMPKGVSLKVDEMRPRYSPSSSIPMSLWASNASVIDLAQGAVKSIRL